MSKKPRWFTHPYGTCEIDGCDKPRRRWMLYCEEHIMERILERSRKIAEYEFNREADIIAEGIRRAKKQT